MRARELIRHPAALAGSGVAGWARVLCWVGLIAPGVDLRTFCLMWPGGACGGVPSLWPLSGRAGTGLRLCGMGVAFWRIVSVKVLWILRVFWVAWRGDGDGMVLLSEVWRFKGSKGLCHVVSRSFGGGSSAARLLRMLFGFWGGGCRGETAGSARVAPWGDGVSWRVGGRGCPVWWCWFRCFGVGWIARRPLRWSALRDVSFWHHGLAWVELARRRVECVVKPRQGMARQGWVCRPWAPNVWRPSGARSGWWCREARALGGVLVRHAATIRVAGEYMGL